jgi:amino acid transporter
MRWRREAAWICGWLYVIGNISITLSVIFGTTVFLVSCINVFESSPGVGVLAGEPYQVFLIFVGLTLLSNAVSALGNKWLPWLDVGVAVFLMHSLLTCKDCCHLLDFCRCYCYYYNRSRHG